MGVFLPGSEFWLLASKLTLLLALIVHAQICRFWFLPRYICRLLIHGTFLSLFITMFTLKGRLFILGLFLSWVPSMYQNQLILHMEFELGKCGFFIFQFLIKHDQYKIIYFHFQNKHKKILRRANEERIISTMYICEWAVSATIWEKQLRFFTSCYSLYSATVLTWDAVVSQEDIF